MKNPFELIETRLACIENLILDLKHQPKQEPQEQIDEPITIPEIAKVLQLAIPTVYSKISKGELPIFKRGKRVYSTHKLIMDYLKEGRIKTNSEIEAEADAYLANKKGGNHA
jgi:excisionase family DNA binding protein